MTEKQVIDEIILYSKMAYDRMLVPGTSGNVSAIYDGKIYVTATNTCLGHLVPEDIVICDMEGNLISGRAKPSKETGMHALVYKKRPNAKCVVHLHPTNVVAFSLLGQSVPPITATYAAKLKEVPMIPFAPTASKELFESVEKTLDEHPDISIFTIAKHGTVAFGENLLHAFFVSDLAEDTCKTAVTMKIMQM